MSRHLCLPSDSTQHPWPSVREPLASVSHWTCHFVSPSPLKKTSIQEKQQPENEEGISVCGNHST